MTEEQAIERIAKAINALSTERPKVNRWDLGCAEAAWQEMKAIAREDGATDAALRQYISPYDYAILTGKA